MRHTYTNTLTERLPTYFFDLRLQGSKKIYFLRLVTCDLI
nr:MAG TPA: hypothetical protein [Caudoviricetes sp.]DAL85767.1 MAG TPA: hypothetical protein [Caudoviricetes sp.]